MNKVVKNASWIVLCRIIQSVLNLIVSMMTARYLGPSNFGIINYAASIVAFVTPLMQLGLRSTLVYELTDRPYEEGKTMGTALFMNVISSVASILFITSFILIFDRDDKTSILVCILYSMSLIFQALEMIQYWFQQKLLSKYTSIVSLIAYVIVSIYKIYLLISGKSIYWFAISQAIDYCLISLLLITIYYKIGGQKFKVSFKRAKEMLSRSKYYIVSSMMVTIFAQTDRIMIKNMIDSNATGYYSAALTCAGMVGFVFSAIIDSMRPVILDNKKHSIDAYELNVSRLFSIVFYLSLAQCVFMTLFAKPIIMILYGKEYIVSINILRVCVWYVTYSYIGQVRNIWILAENKQKYLWRINLVGAISNVVLNYVMIPIWGVFGAAIATVITQFVTNFIVGFIFKPIRDCNKLMIRGFNPLFAYNEIKKIRKR